MKKEVLAELSEIKKILSHIVGTTDLPAPQKFSKAVLDKAARLFKKMALAEEQWVKSYEICNYFENCFGYEIGKFIRDEFAFSNYYSKGGATFYFKKDLMKLADELKSRNVDLATYMELRKGQALIEKKMLELAAKNRDERIKRKRKKNYSLPEELKYIKLSDFKLPDRNVVEQEVGQLMLEFKNGNYARYINFYDDSAYITYNDKIREYLKGVEGKVYRSWCKKYNKAKYGLKLINEHQNRHK